MPGAAGTFDFKPADWQAGETTWWKDTDVVHRHGDDTGHPDTFDCDAWCVGKGASEGSCVVAAAPLCEHAAKCACG